MLHLFSDEFKQRKSQGKHVTENIVHTEVFIARE